jgi:hypothetical protein
MKSKLLILIFAIISIIVVFNEDKEDHNQFWSDTCGYYLYLPAAFIYHDAARFQFFPQINSAYHCAFWLNGALPGRDGKKLDKYPLGVCFFELPLFLVANGYCTITRRYATDGFSLPYQVAAIFSNILFVALGLFILRAFLMNYFGDKASPAILFLTGIK